MKSGMIALSVAAMLAFSTANAATAAAPAAKPATTAPAAPTALTPQEAARVKSHSNTNNNRQKQSPIEVVDKVAAPDAPAKTMTPQQQKMGGCAKANKGKKGDDYKSAVSACMKGGTARSSGHASEIL